MSGAGAPKLNIDASGLAVTICVTSWHDEITGGLLAGAERALQEAGNNTYSIMRVPGAFELPLAAQYAIEQAWDTVAEGDSATVTIRHYRKGDPL